MKQPKGQPIEVFKCKICFKYFATNAHLVGHYKKKHADYFKAHIQDNDKIITDLEVGEIPAHKNTKIAQDQFMDSVKREVLCRYSAHFHRLQETLGQIKDQSGALRNKQEFMQTANKEQLMQINRGLVKYEGEIGSLKEHFAKTLSK